MAKRYKDVATSAQKQSAKQAKANDLRIERLFREHCSYIAINIFDVAKVYKAGTAAIESGASDAEIGATLKAFAESIRAE